MKVSGLQGSRSGKSKIKIKSQRRRTRVSDPQELFIVV